MLFSNTEGAISSQPPSVSFLDHGFLFGDSLYEVVRTYDRKILGWREHQERLLRGADRIGYPIRPLLPEIEKRMQALLVALNEPEAALRMVITRGVGKLHIDWRTCEKPSIFMAAWKFDRAALPKSVRLWISDIRRNSILAMDPAIKSGNYLNNVLAFKEAVENHFEDAVMLNPEGNVTELTTSNIGWVKGQKAFTPKTDTGILHGITRRLLLEAAEVEEGHYSIDELFSADEVFVISTFKEITPVVELGHSSGKRKTLEPGCLTLSLHQKLRARIEARLSEEKRLF